MTDRDLPTPRFDSVREYGRTFTDADYWWPYVREVCSLHGLAPCSDVRPGLPGTFPVFVVNSRWVVKLFGELFDGAAGYRLELEMYHLTSTDPRIPAPTLIGTGSLFPDDADWRWPYLVTDALPGESLTEVWEQVSYGDRLEVCRYLAPVVRHVHALRPPPGGVLSRSWAPFEAFLSERLARCVHDHEAWGSLPPHLVAQLESYLPPLPELMSDTEPHVMHCDLNSDHVLGVFEGGRWRPTGIIDLGDAKAGDRAYELVAMHLGLFRCDKQLLRAFLDEYGFDDELRHDFARRAMSMTLLHEFDVLSGVFEEFPRAREVPALDDLANLLWDPCSPGLVR